MHAQELLDICENLQVVDEARVFDKEVKAITEYLSSTLKSAKGCVADYVGDRVLVTIDNAKKLNDLLVEYAHNTGIRYRLDKHSDGIWSVNLR